MLQLPTELVAVATEICNAALSAVSTLAAQIPQLQPLWDAITNVITQICAALGVG